MKNIALWAVMNSTSSSSMQFKQHGNKLSKQGSNESELMRWLLTILLLRVEAAVLMNDSFQRFKRTNQLLFEKTLNLAVKLDNNSFD